MSQLDFFAILDECVSRLRQGEPPEACLADYPSHAVDLAPDLALTADLFHLSLLEPSPDAVADGYQKMMAALDAQAKEPLLARLSAFMGRLVSPLGRTQRGLAATTLRTAVIAVVILVVAGSLAVTAAADTLPGDVLYPVKRSWENARLTLTTDDSSRQALQTEFERRRREEVQTVLDLRRPVVVEFKGVLESFAPEVWQVDGLDLYITDDTQVDGVVTVGQRVAVRAQVKDDGSLTALKIVVDDSQPLSRSTATFTPQPTQRVLAPTLTPFPKEPRPEPTATGKPTVRPARPTPTLSLRDEPAPIRVPTDHPTLKPTRTAAPSLDREPTRDHRPTNTPSKDSLATAVPHPTVTPVTNTDHPTATATHRPVDVPPPTPTATSRPNQDLDPTRAPTATRNSDTGDRDDRPP